MITELSDMVRLIRGDKSWIEGEAIRQLQATAEYPGMLRCVGMSDIHPAKGSPNGAAFLADRVYPHLVGNDCGCGVALWRTDLRRDKVKIERVIERLDGLDQPWDGDVRRWLAANGITAAPTEYDHSLGTPGFGNHFIELQTVAEIIKPEIDHDIVKGDLYLMVHSGSRGYGEAIMHQHAAQYGATGLMGEAADDYLRQHEHAMAWAVANRQLCAHRVFQALRADGIEVLDACHNSVTSMIHNDCQCWLHRKGAAPADQGIVVIPGTRGDLSYIVDPTASTDALHSLAHGAGRKINRTDAYDKLRDRYRSKDLRRNPYGGRVICGTTELLWQEAPECYKSIDTVIDDMVVAGLIEVVATLQPLVTFKTSEVTEVALHEDRKQRQMQRSAAREAKRGR